MPHPAMRATCCTRLDALSSCAREPCRLRGGDPRPQASKSIASPPPPALRLAGRLVALRGAPRIGGALRSPFIAAGRPEGGGATRLASAARRALARVAASLAPMGDAFDDGVAKEHDAPRDVAGAGIDDVASAASDRVLGQHAHET